ncbi:hypothetical protein BN938_0132 [Mucinivorans hirudinis]|uniref:Uncharacterized protein n=1 Tax=Mucinivorans hirudinis TaxID=1433126 RepID=A0A060R9Z9_9BACT|nr:hypothetical protein BN938_0132 [Mucinivorans hirudinis]
MRTKIERFLERFPTDAKTWHNATDEIRDLARTTREILEDCEKIVFEPIDFKAIKTPAEWNTKGRAYILANFDRMDDTSKRMFYNRFREWFDK